jgi:hypothetical protein
MVNSCCVRGDMVNSCCVRGDMVNSCCVRGDMVNSCCVLVSVVTWCMGNKIPYIFILVVVEGVLYKYVWTKKRIK